MNPPGSATTPRPAADSLAVYAGVPAVVLGAGGFIGRWVARALADRRADLIMIARDAARTGQVLDTLGVRGRLIEADLADAQTVHQMLAGFGPAVVFNLAGYGVDRGERDADLSFRLNRDLVDAVCDAVAGVPRGGWSGQRVVHAGSALEYGVARGNLNEDTQAEPTTIYGRSKLAGTEALVRRSRQSGLAAVSARLFTVYGPGEHDGRLLPSLLDAARRRIALDLTGGRQQRDFTYVEDVAEGLLRLGAAAAAEPLANLATGRLTTVREFVETAAEVLGLAAEQLRFGAIPTRPEEMQHEPVDISRLRAVTGWAPATGIREGIARTQEPGAHGAPASFDDAQDALSGSRRARERRGAKGPPQATEPGCGAEPHST